MQQDFPISASVLLMSSEGRSMFKNSTHVPVKGTNEDISSKKFQEIISDIDLL